MSTSGTTRQKSAPCWAGKGVMTRGYRTQTASLSRTACGFTKPVSCADAATATLAAAANIIWGEIIAPLTESKY
jgi:hypothetical protein